MKRLPTATSASPQPQPKAYSYVRFSTPEQAKGDSYRRQTEKAMDYAQKHGLDLDTSLTFEDLGKSAFRGKNAETGALRQFLRAVEDGHIEEGSYLLVESLDRVSRNAVTDAQGLFLQIIGQGITLVTLGDDRTYSKESVDRNPMDLILSLLTMIRANEESLTKSRRLKAAYANKRQQAETTGKLFTRVVPGWIRVTPEGTLEAIPEREAIVQRIFSLFLDGTGKEGIAKLLNSEGHEVWGRGNRKGMHWHASYVNKILDSPAVIGTLTTRTVETEKGKAVKKDAQQIAGYYPRVIDDETFARVRAIRDTSTVTRSKGKAPAKNLLAGLAVCPCCGGAMIRVNKGSGGKAGKPYLVCGRAKVGAGCPYKAVGLEIVETTVRGAYRELSEALLAEGNSGLVEEIAKLETETSVLADEMENIADTIAMEGHSPVLARKMRELQSQMDTATKALKAKRVQLFTQTHAMRRARITDLQPLLEGADVAKASLALRELLRSIVVNHQTGDLECTTKGGVRVDLTYQSGFEPDDEEGGFVAARKKPTR
jgi:DNA invertase Pin-like site-specific DNA recombinase